MRSYLKLFFAMVVMMPACDGFVCSQARIKAMEMNNRGVEAFNNGLLDTAERELRLAIQTDPTYEVSYHTLGKVYQKQNKWDKAAESFEGAAERAPANAVYHHDLGEAYLEARHLEQAERALKRATELDPSLYRAHYRLGLVYRVLERPKDADQSLRKAIEANARFDMPFVELGHLYLDFDASGAAEQVFSECVRANEDSAECLNGHGLALKDLRKYEPAVAEFKRALEVEPSLHVAVYNAGMTYAEWFEASNANEHKEKAVEYLSAFVKSGKDGAVGYVKAANDKLYALSGS